MFLFVSVLRVFFVDHRVVAVLGMFLVGVVSVMAVMTVVAVMLFRMFLSYYDMSAVLLVML